MRSRLLGLLVSIGAAAAMLAPASAPLAAQGSPPQTAAWTPPRTPDGQPDIQGFWSQRNNITTYSLLEGEADRADHIKMTGQAPATGKPVKTPDGKIPYQPWAAEKAAFLHEEHRHPSKPEYLDPVTRGFLEGVPRINLQGNFQILQFPGQVVIIHDYAHSYRVIPLDGRPRLSDTVKLWMGDSRGHWEGNTLVVDVRNNNEHTWFDIVGAGFHSDALHLVERWTPVAADRIDYEVTIEDPKVYTKPWKMAWNFGRNEPDEQWENAVWEGNKAPQIIFGNRRGGSK